MLRTIRCYLSSVLVLSLVASLLALAQSGASAEEAVYEAEGVIAGPNPASADVGGVTELSFLAACDVPPTQGLDGYVFELPEGFGAGDATVEVSGDDLTGAYDLDVFFYKADCSGAGGSIATTAPDESGPIPAETKWIVVNAWFGVDTVASLKASRQVGPPVLGVGLKPSAKRITYGDDLKVTGTVTGCSPGFLDVYSVSLADGLRPLGQVEVSETGTYEIEGSPTVNTKYFSEVGDGGECPAMHSKRKVVKVEPQIRINRERKCRWIRGRVVPNQKFTRARFQRKSHGRWNTVDRDLLNRHSRFKLQFPSCHGRYRVLWSAAGSQMARTWRGV